MRQRQFQLIAQSMETSMSPAQTKPNEPNYSGGEDEDTGNNKNRRNPPSAQTPPVDESDDSPSTAPDDVGEG
jgi:hypothetical protein